MKIKTGDSIIVIAGKDKGKTGKVAKAFPKENAVLVEGVNMRKRHERPKTSSGKGQIVEKAMPIDASNVMILEGGKRARLGKKRIGEKFVRVSKKSGKEV